VQFDAVEAQGLFKVYGATRALSGVSARFGSGQVTVIEGPNGSGKSTLLSLLSLRARPSRGALRFGDYDAATHRGLRGHIGLLAHAAMVYPELTGIENLELSAKLYGLYDVPARITAMRERFDLGRFAERAARTYSRGQLQRVALARALLHAPKLLLLDEPSTGLDQLSTARLCQAIEDERTRDAIVVLVTHDQALSLQIANAHVRLSRGRVVDSAQESVTP